MYFNQIDEIVNGTKTQTRRIVKGTELYEPYENAVYIATRGGPFPWNWANGKRLKWSVGNDYAVSPGRGKPGVWWNPANGEWGVSLNTAGTDLWQYEQERNIQLGWEPLRIVITAIRREPLQAITEEDAIAEGYPMGKISLVSPSPVLWYRDLWENINGRGAWDQNPDVWVIEFAVKR